MFALAISLWCFTHQSLGAPGDVDPSFNPDLGINAAVYALARQADGKVLVGGAFYSTNVSDWVHLSRLTPNGSLDTSYNIFLGEGGANYIFVATVAMEPGGQALLGGGFNQVNGSAELDLARVSAQGVPDATFAPELNFYTGVSALVVRTNGTIVVGGQFSANINGTNCWGIAQLNSDGSLDTTFNPGSGLNGVTPVSAWVVAMQPDGKVLLGGSFFSVNGVSRINLARLNANGSLDTSFDPGNLLTPWVYAVAVQPDGKVLVGTDINFPGGRVRTNLVRLNGDGSLDPTFEPGAASSAIYALALQPDGTVLVGGDFTTFNGTNRSYLARLKADGTLDPAYTPQADGTVRRLLLQPDGNLLVGGSFTSINAVPRPGLARLLGEPVLLGLQPGGGQVVLNWPNPAYSLQAAGAPFGPFTNVPVATSPYTNPVNGSAQFFRLICP